MQIRHSVREAISQIRGIIPDSIIERKKNGVRNDTVRNQNAVIPRRQTIVGVTGPKLQDGAPLGVVIVRQDNPVIANINRRGNGVGSSVLLIIRTTNRRTRAGSRTSRIMTTRDSPIKRAGRGWGPVRTGRSGTDRNGRRNMRGRMRGIKHGNKTRKPDPKSWGQTRERTHHHEAG